MNLDCMDNYELQAFIDADETDVRLINYAKLTRDAREARLGYEAPAEETSPYLRSSPSDAAWRVGAWLRRTFRSPPSGVRTGRGDLVHVNNMQVKLCWDYDPVTIERIA